MSLPTLRARSVFKARCERCFVQTKCSVVHMRWGMLQLILCPMCEGHYRDEGTAV